jgi:ribosome maturation factor RimP
VDVEFSGGTKFRTLRVFIEKDAETRAKLAEIAESAEAGEPLDPLEPLPALPANVPVALLSFTTHEDCEAFTRDFGTLLDVEDMIPGAEYTLEVSSPGLERKLSSAADFTRFTGSPVKLQTFTAVHANRHFEGRLTAFDGTTLTLDTGAVKQKKTRGQKTAGPASQVVEIALANVEKAHLLPDI